MAEEGELNLKNLAVADEAELKLLTTKFSPFGQRVEVALKEKKIPFQTVLVDLTNKPRELLEANPIRKTVPTIIHNGKPVAESLVILEYLEDAFPEQVPLMPKGAYEKSKYRFWVDYIYKTFTGWADGFRSKPGTPEKQAFIDKCMQAFKTLEEGMASFSADGPFFTGENFGMIDVAMAPFCNLGLVLQELAGVVIPGPDQLPRFHKWIEAAKVRPSVSSTVPPAEEALEYFKANFAKRAAAAAAAAAGPQ